MLEACAMAVLHFFGIPHALAVLGFRGIKDATEGSHLGVEPGSAGFKGAARKSIERNRGVRTYGIVDSANRDVKGSSIWMRAAGNKAKRKVSTRRKASR
jgi:hypothetical protein